MKTWLSLLAVLVAIALQFLLPYRGTKELAFVAQDVAYLDQSTLRAAASDLATLLPFEQPDGYGYHSPDLKGFLFTEFSPDTSVTVGKDFSLSHDWGSGVTSIISRSATTEGTFISTGVVMNVNERIYEISQPTHQIREISSSGQLLWQTAYLTPPTSLDNNAERTSIAYVNGYLNIHDNQGTRIGEYRYSGSRINAIYGHAINADGQYLALIGGLDPQRFQLLRLLEGSYYPLVSQSLSEQRTSSYWMRFSQQLPYVFYSLDQNLVAYNYQAAQSLALSFSDRLLTFEENTRRGLQFFLGGGEGQGSLLAIFGVQGVFLDLAIERRPYSLASRGDDVYLALENAIAHYRLMEI